ncbi:rho GTPase-activating protein 21-B-like isoform X2 [Homarus americanus]|uniref:rho GTPase-activating protein 21-B-like isoform X2 n=1 Tax=Homarus americanus TaxID=6706 RepID=UPI001C448B83|nr:rho GTPase-activating protein 21-B-like isoform X2 [Homarus americanus]
MTHWQHANTQTPLGVEEQISLRGAEVEVASDYTKRRNVLRLATPGGSQLLLQADTPPEMLAWLSTLQNNCVIQEGETGSKTPINNNNVSPQPSNKAMRKLTSSLRTRSPTGQSPSTKTRKPSSVESNSSPKSKTWRGHLKRPFMKKIPSGSPAVTPTMPLPEGATIGVCLEDCPQSLENEFVPLLVALCVGVVESRGLQTQGIYRIPGNKAAVTHLTEMINKDPKSIEYDDPRWCDVNVISSMLKQFFQKLPDPLFTCELYPLFIEASKIEDPCQRMVELRKMVRDLPDHHYETLRFLILHLHNIVCHCDMNKMDVRNLAIVFGPTLVRSGDDNMVTMVTDMSHQCRIVETLISQALWFFNEDDGEESIPPVISQSVIQSPAGDCLPLTSECDTPSSQALLLHNIQKVEGNIRGDMKKDIVSSIISAANRKVQKVKYKKPVEDKPVDDSKYSDKDGGFEERDIDKEAELRKQRLLAKQIESMVELPDPKPMSERKISNMSLMSVQSHPSGVSSLSQSLNSERTSGSEQTKLGISGDNSHPFCVVKKDGVGTNTGTASLALTASTPTISTPATSQQSSHLTPEMAALVGDEVAIRSYAGLTASTQERIRRFEMETRAMLHRDVTRHRRETERRDIERQRLDELWQRAKQDMESEDILDQMADNPTEVVRKISDYSWRLQGLSESVGGERGSLASQGSTTSSQAALISAALSHHPLSNTSLTPTTNATAQVPNNHSQLPVIKIVSEPSVGMACDATNDSKHGMIQQSSLPWLEYNAASPHSTLGSTSSSGSSGYGSLTRSSHASNPGDTEDTGGKAVEESCQIECSKDVTKSCTGSRQSSPSNPKKKKSSKASGFLFGLTSSSSSPSLFPSMTEAAAELTPTRKIGQTTIYPESPRPPPHNVHSSSQSHLTAPSTTLTPNPNTPLQGRHKDSILHHILPSRLYHSPRPLRRGSSAENVTQPLVTPISPSTFDTQKVVNNGTLKRARTSRDQILNGPETGMPRCGSLDSLRDGPHVSHDDGSDLLSAITATFEEKMRSLQESPLGLVTAVSDDPITSPDPSPEAGQTHDRTTRGNSECRLYRDPSLHRRRTNPRSPSANSSSTSTAANTTLPPAIAQVEAASQAVNYVENDNKLLNEEVTREVKVKRSDSLTKSEKTENNLKEKTEKRARELKRTDTQESLSEKKPKEMKRSDIQDGTERSRDLPRKSEVKDNSVGSTRRTSEVRSRRHNVKELKEKFEQNTSSQSSTSPMKPSNNHYSNVNNNSNKANKSSMRRTGYRGPIKRRHTVGGTKDLAKWAWLHSGEVSRNTPRSTRLSAWERLQPLVADERLNTDRSLEAWLAHERIRTSSPDLSRPQQLVRPRDIDDKENIHRRLSVQEATLNPLYPVLESHV